MLFKLLSSQKIIYNLILLFCFCLSVNYFDDFKLINYIAYVFFHLTLIYLVFYSFHFSVILISFLYGVFLDIFLINNIAPHLISFLIFVILFLFTKKYLLNLSSRKISYLIIFITLIMFIVEALIANLQFNYPINYENLIWLSVISIIVFFPSLIIFNKIDKI